MLHFIRQGASLARDLVSPTPSPQHILTGKRLFRPFLRYQHSWLQHFYPGESINPDISTWVYLQKFMMPLIKQRASQYHLDGIQKLNLESTEKPDFDDFSERFYQAANGFQVCRVNDEIEPVEYFTLISQRKFPCINILRPHDELFCANEPDFWHEAIGHLAPLCSPQVQDFYLDVAQHVLSARSREDFENQMAVAWTILEYGFIRQCGLVKMFGAALVGSHLAHMRYQYQHISIEPAARSAIIDSGFYTEDTPLARNHRHKIRFFCLDNLTAGNLFTD